MRGGVARAALLAAASLGIAGAQRLDAKSLLNEAKVENKFDPFAALRAVGLNVTNREGKPKIAKNRRIFISWHSRDSEGRGRTRYGERNKAKRARRAALASAKGAPGGWKLVTRRLSIRARQLGTRWPA
jgi:hypothetical protein